MKELKVRIPDRLHEELTEGAKITGYTLQDTVIMTILSTMYLTDKKSTIALLTQVPELQPYAIKFLVMANK